MRPAKIPGGRGNGGIEGGGGTLSDFPWQMLVSIQWKRNS